MGGYSSGSGGSPGGGGTARQAKTFQKKNKPTPVKDFITGGGVTGAVVRGVSGAIKNQKTKNRKSKSGDVYAGDAYGYNEAKEKKDYKPNKVNQDLRTGEGNQVASTKSIEQPKVKSQMDNTEVKSNLITAKGPTDIEMNNTELTQDEEMLKIKRRGRKRTTLTNLTEQEKPTLSKKVLLG